MALYHALMESILVDEDSTDQNVVDTQKKRNPADDDRDEDPPTRSNQGLKRRKTSKDADPSKRPKSTDTNMPQNQGDDVGHIGEQPNVEYAPKYD
ncbi:hypothetical protein Tco_0182282 [Tanacetum coccineum]